jgi:hypothetical protein
MIDEIYKKLNFSTEESQRLFTEICFKQQFSMDDHIEDENAVAIFKIMFRKNNDGELEVRISTANNPIIKIQ